LFTAEDSTKEQLAELKTLLKKTKTKSKEEVSIDESRKAALSIEAELAAGILELHFNKSNGIEMCLELTARKTQDLRHGNFVFEFLNKNVGLFVQNNSIVWGLFDGSPKSGSKKVLLGFCSYVQRASTDLSLVAESSPRFNAALGGQFLLGNGIVPPKNTNLAKIDVSRQSNQQQKDKANGVIGFGLHVCMLEKTRKGDEIRVVKIIHTTRMDCPRLKAARSWQVAGRIRLTSEKNSKGR
jgi:hypothetical protein